jgi:hypothetical protein
MKRSAKTDSADIQGDASPGRPRKRRAGKRSIKNARTGRGSGIRESEEARALLEDELSSLYWWVFNAFKMKGFIRAKALDELEGANANGEKRHIEQGDFTEAGTAAEK